MNALVDLWNGIGYFEGFLFTVWLVGLYWGKKRLDFHFARRTQHAWDRSIYKVRIVEDSHISVDHANIENIQHAHIDDIGEIHGDVTTHPKPF